ncbi:MAG TPA: pyrroloquinoline quinone biosynthesis peptide chaperone PqqD [Candidatus Binataceae bacterium]|jgi:pyrroloquinoline quinone biosynthesis protein D|nr:pyrroloquinoline quinone biosynthesis peptide chaperone PqqD [Candidatus Binataceae bacterium]
MNQLDSAAIPALAPHYRLQWEPAQNAHVLLYPEGMIRLSPSAAEIMRRIDGSASVEQIVVALEAVYAGADLRADVVEFLTVAAARGWLRMRQRA